MEAAIPEQAMPNWSDERRDQWVYMVKYAADVEELLVWVLYLEACIDRFQSFGKSSTQATLCSKCTRILTDENL
jgi:hypothetical protein